MQARLYQPCKTAMQSGKAKTHYWVLEFLSTPHLFTYPLTGWTGSDNTLSQVKLHFNTKEEALLYAKNQQIKITEEPVNSRRPRIRNYSDNFKANRKH